MIRILQVVHIMNRGGTETMIMNLYRHIDRSKVQFDFIQTCEGPALFDEEIQSLGGRIYHCPAYKGTNHFEFTRWWKGFFKEHQGEYSIIHGHLGSTAAIYLGIAKHFGLHTIAHSHNIYRFSLSSTIMYMLYSYWTRFIAESFFACSREAAISRFGKKLGNDSRRCRVLYNAIELEDFEINNDKRRSLREQFNMSNDMVIGHVGRFQKQKNHEFIIDIFKCISQRMPNVKLLLIGDGPLREKIEEKIAENNLKDKVIFAGVRSDVNELLQAMDVFVFPSLYEGLPLSLVEAQTSGLPIFASTNVPRESDVTGLCQFLPLGNAEEWADAILAADISHRRSHIEECRKAGYDINETAQWLQNFYLELAEK